MLDDASGLEERGHEGEVTADVGEWAVGEEDVGVAPEVLRVAGGEVSHSVCAIFSVLLFGVSEASDYKLDAIVILMQYLFEGVDDKVDTFLFGDASDECEDGEVAVEFIHAEVFLL
jgi:hypothetical protein